MITAKIIRKSKEGVTLYAKGAGKVDVSWKEFEEHYDVDKDDKFKAILKPEIEEKVKRANEIADEAVVYLMMSNGSNALNGYYGLGKKMEELCKIMECSMAEGMDLVRHKMEEFVSAGLKEGIGFGKPYNNFMNKSQKKRNWENHKKLENERKTVEKTVDTTDAYHYTLGDSIKLK